MIPHDLGACRCIICRTYAEESLQPLQADRDLLAAEWEKWISSTDGEAAKLRRGEDGNAGSPRWVALQAIARSRLAARAEA